MSVSGLEVQCSRAGDAVNRALRQTTGLDTPAEMTPSGCCCHDCTSHNGEPWSNLLTQSGQHSLDDGVRIHHLPEHPRGDGVPVAPHQLLLLPAQLRQRLGVLQGGGGGRSKISCVRNKGLTKHRSIIQK